MCGSTSVIISYSVSVYDRERERVARRTPHSITHLAFSHSESIHDRKRERGSCSKSLAFDGEKTGILQYKGATALVTSQAASSSPCVFLHPSPAVSSFDSVPFPPPFATSDEIHRIYKRRWERFRSRCRNSLWTRSNHPGPNRTSTIWRVHRRCGCRSSCHKDVAAK